MTNYPAPLDQKYGADQADLLRRLSNLETQVAQLTSGPVACTAATHPANPFVGMQIYETDTDLQAYWSGAAWVYPPQAVWSTTLATNQASVTTPTLPQVFNFLRLEYWIHRTTTGSTDLTMQVDSVATNNYLWSKMESASTTQGNSHAGAATNVMKVGTLGGTTSAYFSTGSVTIGGWSSNAGYLTTAGIAALFDSNTVDYIDVTGSLFAGTGPHSTLTFAPLAGSLQAGSRFLLVGLG